MRSPWSAYELLVKTAVMRGRAVPRGQLELPKDPRMHQDVVLYFTDEGRAEEALQAGATYAGGVDLIPKVSYHSLYILEFISHALSRFWLVNYNLPKSSRLPHSSL